MTCKAICKLQEYIQEWRWNVGVIAFIYIASEIISWVATVAASSNRTVMLTWSEHGTIVPV